MKYIHFYMSARIIKKNSGNKKGAKRGCKNQENNGNRVTVTVLQ